MTKRFAFSTRLLLKKKFFLFFALTPSQMWLKRLFIGVSRVRASVRANFLPSHLPSLPSVGSALAGFQDGAKASPWNFVISSLDMLGIL